MPDETQTTETKEEELKEKSILVLFRFILVPLVVVGIVVFIIIIFGQMALKEKSVSDYLYDIRTGSQSERWQAAYQLSTLLANPKKDYTEQARKQLPEIMLIFIISFLKGFISASMKFGRLFTKFHCVRLKRIGKCFCLNVSITCAKKHPMHC